MRAFVALTPEAAERVSDARQAILHGIRVDFGFIRTGETEFDPLGEHRDSVLVHVDAFSCNFRERSRILGMAGGEGRRYAVLGSEFAGRVVAVGAAVTTFLPGERVCGDGSTAVDSAASHPGLSTQRASLERQVHHHTKLFRIPDAMPTDVGAAFSVGAQTGYSMVRRIGLVPGAQVAVTAATSNTSLFAIQAAVRAGLHVHAFTTSERHVARLQRLGVKGICVLSPSAPTAPRISAYLAASRLSRFDGVIDPFCDIYTRKLIPFIGRFGTYVTCGVFDQFTDVRMDPFLSEGIGIGDLFNHVIRMSITLVGNNLGSTADLEAAAEDYLDGALTVDLDSVSAPAEADRFFERSFLDRGRFGKVVLSYAA